MTHDERIFYHTYTTCEGIAEHAERIVALEELVADMLEDMISYELIEAWRYLIRAEELEIKVSEPGIGVD